MRSARSMTILILSSLPLVFSSAVYAHGEHGKNGPCKQYFQSCKDDASVKDLEGKAKWEAMSKCVNAAAANDGDNGKACVAAQAKHHGHRKRNEGT